MIKQSLPMTKNETRLFIVETDISNDTIWHPKDEFYKWKCTLITGQPPTTLGWFSKLSNLVNYVNDLFSDRDYFLFDQKADYIKIS